MDNNNKSFSLSPLCSLLSIPLILHSSINSISLSHSLSLIILKLPPFDLCIWYACTCTVYYGFFSGRSSKPRKVERKSTICGKSKILIIFFSKCHWLKLLYWSIYIDHNRKLRFDLNFFSAITKCRSIKRWPSG